MGHDVFISHAAKDKATADAVCAALETNGIRCWIAPRDILPGESWASSTLRGIATCRMMVLVFSAAANGSAHIRREVERAVHHGMPIAPIRIQDAMPAGDLEYFLSSSHWMDALTPPLEQHLRTLAAKVRALLEMDASSPVPAPNLAAAPTVPTPVAAGSMDAPPARRRRIVVTLAACLLTAALVTAWALRGDLARWFGAARGRDDTAQAQHQAPPAEHPAEPARALKDLFLTARITADQYKLGQLLLNSAPTELDDYNTRRRAQFVDLLQGRLSPDKLGEALAVIETPEQKTLRLRDKLATYYAVTNTLGMKFVRIEAGEFLMGSPANEEGRVDNETQHNVKITKAFMMDIHHVTKGRFAAFVRDAGYQTDAEKEGFAYAWDGTKFDKVNGASWSNPGFDQGDDHPVVEVSWNDAVAFCKWLSQKEGKTYHLPTEAEWEYACRAGTQTVYFWGDSPDAGQGFANWADLTAKDKFPAWTTFNWRDGFVYTSPVGSFKPNAWGLYDMIGNALDWCNDWYGTYPDGEVIDPQGPAVGPARVLRGGSWYSQLPRYCRCANRGNGAPDYRDFNLGFRVVLDFQ